MTKQKHSTKNWKKYAFEMISIIMGVLVALAVDEWRENRQNTQRAHIAISNVHQELKSNLALLDIIHPENMKAYHMMQSDSAENDSATIFPALQLQDVAWHTLLNNGIAVHIAYDELLKISELYSLQDIYKDFGKTFLDQLMEVKTISTANGKTLSNTEIVESSQELIGLMLGIETPLRAEIAKYLSGVSSDLD